MRGVGQQIHFDRIEPNMSDIQYNALKRQPNQEMINHSSYAGLNFRKFCIWGYSLGGNWQTNQVSALSDTRDKLSCVSDACLSY